MLYFGGFFHPVKINGNKIQSDFSKFYALKKTKVMAGGFFYPAYF
jgi:hypothetical protein